MNTGTQSDLEEANTTKKTYTKDAFACRIGDCPLKYSNPSILARHRLQHNWEHLDDGGQKWFCCDICPRMFKMFHVLEKHRATHDIRLPRFITFKPTKQKDLYNFNKSEVKQEPIQDIVVKIEPFHPNSEEKSIKCESQSFVEKSRDYIKAEPMDLQTYPNIWNTRSFQAPIVSDLRNQRSYTSSSVRSPGTHLRSNQSSASPDETSTDSFEENVETTKSQGRTHSFPQIKSIKSLAGCEMTNTQMNGSEAPQPDCSNKKIRLSQPEEDFLDPIQTSEEKH